MAAIFVAIAFDQPGRARADSIASMLRLGTHTALFGDHLNGESISTSVQQRIEGADGLIAVCSRNECLANGDWTTSSWIIEEATWAKARNKPVLIIVEDGISTIGGIFGDIELIRFPVGQFECCVPRITSFVEHVASVIAKQMRPVRPVEKRDTALSIIPQDHVEDCWGDEVKKLIEATREKADLELYQDALFLATRVTELAPDCWRGHLNRGVALVHLGRYTEAAKVFDYVAMSFSDSTQVVARALHNKAWLVGVRDGLADKSGLEVRKELYMQSLALDNRRIFTRAMVLICMILLHQEEVAEAFLRASLKWQGFPAALKDELKALGALGHQVIRQFPPWLQDVLFPTHTAEGGKRYDA